MLRTLNELLDKVPLLEHVQLEHHHWPRGAGLAHISQPHSAHSGLHLLGTVYCSRGSVVANAAARAADKEVCWGKPHARSLAKMLATSKTIY